jgi:hypothetical protein
LKSAVANIKTNLEDGNITVKDAQDYVLAPTHLNKKSINTSNLKVKFMHGIFALSVLEPKKKKTLITEFWDFEA